MVHLLIESGLETMILKQRMGGNYRTWKTAVPTASNVVATA